MGWEDTYKNQLAMPTLYHHDAAKVRTPDVGGATRFDLETYLSLELIRLHTKTEDVPSVSDEQLSLYRQSAVEAAEQYTGLLLAGSRSQIENVEIKYAQRVLMHGYFTHKTKYPITDGIAYLYGSVNTSENRRIDVAPGSRSIKIPVVSTALDLSSSCCRPACSGAGEINYGMKLMYRAGYAACEHIPAGIKLGMLKYIAWSITHPGDVLLTVRLRESSDEGLVRGTNNAAWASGALELWRQYVDDAT